ncbi:hypothetical protein ADUPG1_010764 [Aduncisulcus paluster]|uniref:Uncharacterized protein n=1 Tax=Aduncisulcus paluster TaxID=2918883 RepID=A0ABQ5JVI6_9EUKA|nr:hypothetical protein ADUPG1_010764 [Aduncisulcus paluster]
MHIYSGILIFIVFFCSSIVFAYPKTDEKIISDILDNFLFFTDTLAENASPTDSFTKAYLSSDPEIQRYAYTDSLVETIGDFFEDIADKAKAYTSTISDAISSSLNKLTTFDSLDLSFALDSTLPLDSNILIPDEDIPTQFLGFKGESFQMSYNNLSYFIPPTFHSTCSQAKRDFALAHAIKQTVGSDYDESIGGLSTYMNAYLYGETNNMFIGFQRVVGTNGLEFTYPAIYSGASFDDASVSVSSRMTRDPLDQPGIVASSSFVMRRGVVIVLDTTIDKLILPLLSHEIGGNVFDRSSLGTNVSVSDDVTSILSQVTYQSLLLSLLSSLSEYISSLNDNTYLAIVDTSGEWRGHLFPESSTAAKTCYGQATSTKRTGGLARMTVEARTKLIANIKRYLGSMSDLSSHTIDNTANAHYAEENSPLFSATSLAIQLLRAAIDPSVALTDILDEKISSMSYSSRTERDILHESARPLAYGSPLSIVFMSLGATPHTYFLPWLKRQMNSIPGAPILPIWMFLDSQKALLNGYGEYENSSFAETNDPSLFLSLQHNVSQIDTIFSHLREMRGAVLRIDVPSASEAVLSLIKTYGGESLILGASLCGTITNCDRNIIAWAEMFGMSTDITNVIGDVKRIDVSYAFQTFIGLRCSMSDATDITDCTHNIPFISSIIPNVFAPSSDPVNGKATMTISKALFNADLEIVGYVMTYIDLDQIENAIYQDPINPGNSEYLMSTYGSKYDDMFLRSRYSYYMMFSIDGTLMSHSALTVSGKNSTEASIDELEVIVSSESASGSISFSELILDTIIDGNVEEGVVSAIVLRQTHENVDFVNPVVIEYHYSLRDSGFIFVVSLGARDVIEVFDPILTNKCDPQYPTSYDSTYSGLEFDPLTTKEAFSGKNSTEASIDELEVIVSSESASGSISFSELILDTIIDGNVEEGVVSAIVLRQTHENVDFVNPVVIEYHYSLRDSGFIFVVSLGARDVIEVFDPILTNKCDPQYPTSYDSTYSGLEFDPLTTKEACFYPSQFSIVGHLSNTELAQLGYKGISDEYTLFTTGTLVYNGVEFFLEDETIMQRLGLTEQDMITVDIAQDITNFFNGDPASQTWGSNGELASVRLASMYSYYWTYQFGLSDSKKTVIFANGLIDTYYSILNMFMYPPYGYGLNLTERGYFQEALGMGYDANYIFASLFMIYPAGIPVFTVLSPIVVDTGKKSNSYEINEVVRFSTLTIFTTTIVNQALNESLCGESGYECYIVSLRGEVLFVNHSQRFADVVTSVEDGDPKYIFDLSPGIGNSLLENDVFKQYDVFCPYGGSVDSQFYFNADALTDSVSVSVGGETFTQTYLSGQISSECVGGSIIPEFILFQDIRTNILAIVITNYPDNDLCTSSLNDSSGSSSSTEYESMCDLVMSVCEISHIWSLGGGIDGTGGVCAVPNDGMVSFCTYESCFEYQTKKRMVDTYDIVGTLFVGIIFAFLLVLCFVINLF